MAFPYSAGDVLTAADLNASSGLVLVKSQTIGVGVSSVTVSNAFSSTFNDYKIILSNADASSNGTDIYLRLGSATTNYYYAGTSTLLSSGPNRISGNNVSQWAIATSDASNATAAVVELFSPNLTFRTAMMARGAYVVVYDVAGFLSDTNQYTAFTISIASGTLSGGTIKVYGYNNG